MTEFSPDRANALSSDRTSALPPDRARVLTETVNPRTLDLHRQSVAELVATFERENAAVMTAMAAAHDALTTFISAVEPRFLAGGRLIYLGAGTSGRLAVLDASEAPPTFMVAADRIIGLIAGGDRSLRISSEGKEDEPEGAHAELDALDLNARDSVLGIAAGGSTPYVLGALHCAQQHGALTGLLSCSPVTRPTVADHLIVLATGPEVLTGSTRLKAGTATKLALNTISTALMVRSGKVYQNLMVDVRASNAKLRDRAARIISTLTNLDRPAAFTALDAAGGSVKTAVIMVRLNLDRAAAEARLLAVGGRLDWVLEPAHDTTT